MSLLTMSYHTIKKVTRTEKETDVADVMTGLVSTAVGLASSVFK